MTALIGFIIAIVVAVSGLFYYAPTKAPDVPADGTLQTQTTEGNTPPASTFTSVNRSGQGLTKMPHDILAMTAIQQLDLSHNALIGAIPAEIRHLSNLEVLNISNNEMTGLPAELGQLSKLRILNAANNQLTGIPHELGNLQQLEILDLSGNDISAQDLQIIRTRLPESTKIIQ